MVSWKKSALVSAFAMMGMVACGGGDAGMDDTGMDEMPAEMPAETPAMGGETAMPANLPEGVTPEMVTLGQQVFTGQAGNGTCYTCHGMDANGTPLAPNLHDDTWLNISGRNYDEIVQLVKTGVPTPIEAPAAMAPMGGAMLTDEQVNAVAAYVVSLGQG